MKNQSKSEIEFQLSRILSKYFESVSHYPWALEQDRWVELIFSLISKKVNKPEHSIRIIIEELDNLGLLDIQKLSSIPKISQKIDLNFSYSKCIIEILINSQLFEDDEIEFNFSENEAELSLLIMHEAAKSLVENHDGKIQKYLRKYGNQIINEISDNFSISIMSDSELISKVKLKQPVVEP